MVKLRLHVRKREAKTTVPVIIEAGDWEGFLESASRKLKFRVARAFFSSGAEIQGKIHFRKCCGLSPEPPGTEDLAPASLDSHLCPSLVNGSVVCVAASARSLKSQPSPHPTTSESPAKPASGFSTNQPSGSDFLPPHSTTETHPQTPSLDEPTPHDDEVDTASSATRVKAGNSPPKKLAVAVNGPHPVRVLVPAQPGATLPCQSIPRPRRGKRMPEKWVELCEPDTDRQAPAPSPSDTGEQVPDGHDQVHDNQEDRPEEEGEPSEEGGVLVVGEVYPTSWPGYAQEAADEAEPMDPEVDWFNWHSAEK